MLLLGKNPKEKKLLSFFWKWNKQWVAESQRFLRSIKRITHLANFKCSSTPYNNYQYSNFQLNSANKMDKAMQVILVSLVALIALNTVSEGFSILGNCNVKTRGPMETLVSLVSAYRFFYILSEIWSFDQKINSKRCMMVQIDILWICLEDNERDILPLITGVP